VKPLIVLKQRENKASFGPKLGPKLV
jgi:hypothetical protein